MRHDHNVEVLISPLENYFKELIRKTRQNLNWCFPKLTSLVEKRGYPVITARACSHGIMRSVSRPRLDVGNTWCDRASSLELKGADCVPFLLSDPFSISPQLLSAVSGNYTYQPPCPLPCWKLDWPNRSYWKIGVRRRAEAMVLFSLSLPWTVSLVATFSPLWHQRLPGDAQSWVPLTSATSCALPAVVVSSCG